MKADIKLHMDKAFDFVAAEAVKAYADETARLNNVLHAGNK